MQAVAAEFSGCAEKLYCFLERRVENTSFDVVVLENPDARRFLLR